MTNATKYLSLFFINLFLLTPLSSLAAVLSPNSQPILNTLSYQVTVEKWSQTNTANVTVSLDAALNTVGLAGINTHFLENLKKIANSGAWHITQFNRGQDKSGLEVLHIEAEARLSENDLTGLREKAKSITKPGETYTVSGIDFSPSTSESQQTHAVARMEVYNKIKEEIARLNQIYPDQHYFLHSVDFTSPQPPMTAMVAAPAESYQPSKLNSFAGAGVAMLSERMSPMSVSSKIVETAQVVISSVAATSVVNAQG